MLSIQSKTRFLWRLWRKPTCYVFLSRLTIWVIFRQTVVYKEARSKPWNETDLFELCNDWKGSRVVLFLDTPWLLTKFQTTIPLTKADALGFARQSIQSGAHEHSVFPQVGAALFTSHSSNQSHLLSVGIPPNTQTFIDRLALKCGIPVIPVPMVYVMLNMLLRHRETAGVLTSPGLHIFVERHRRAIKHMVRLPDSWAPRAVSKLLADSFVDLPDPLPTLTVIPDRVSPKLNPHEVSAHTLIAIWKRLTRRKDHRFWWDAPTRKRPIPWKSLAVVGWLSILTCIVALSFWVENQNRGLYQELKTIQDQLNTGNAQLTYMEDYKAQQNRFVEVDTLYSHLSQSSGLVRDVLRGTLRQLPIGVWVETLVVDTDQVQLTLLTNTPLAVADSMEVLEQSSQVASVRIGTQQQVVLQGYSLTQFTLLLQLQVDHAALAQNSTSPRVDP